MPRTVTYVIQDPDSAKVSSVHFERAADGTVTWYATYSLVDGSARIVSNGRVSGQLTNLQLNNLTIPQMHNQIVLPAIKVAESL